MEAPYESSAGYSTTHKEHLKRNLVAITSRAVMNVMDKIQCNVLLIRNEITFFPHILR